MKIRPSREVSSMQLIMCIAAAIFGIFWMSTASSIGAGGFGMLGIVFILIAIVFAFMHFRNATGKKAFSLYEITDDQDASKKYPLDNNNTSGRRPQKSYCPWCGGALDNSKYIYCPKCGKQM